MVAPTSKVHLFLELLSLRNMATCCFADVQMLCSWHSVTVVANMTLMPLGVISQLLSCKCQSRSWIKEKANAFDLEIQNTFVWCKIVYSK